MNESLHVLIVEDSEDDAELLLRHLRRSGYSPQAERVETAQQMTVALRQSPWDVVIADYCLPTFSGQAALQLLRDHDSELPFIMVSGGMTDADGVVCMQNGAQDYVMKGNLSRLAPAVDRELREFEMRHARRRLEEVVRNTEAGLEIAHAIQQQLFPRTSPNCEDFDIAGQNYPAEATGGDYYDFIAGPDGSWILAIGDVSGHGLGPAIQMAQARTCLRALVAADLGLTDILTEANRLFFADFSGGSFITLFLLKITPGSSSVDFAAAGHQAFLLDSDGDLRKVLQTNCIPLGILGVSDFSRSGSATVHPGEILLLVTDGFYEAECPSNKQFGLERVFDTVRKSSHLPAQAIATRLQDAVFHFCENRTQADDMTCVVAKRIGSRTQ